MAGAGKPVAWGTNPVRRRPQPPTIGRGQGRRAVAFMGKPQSRSKQDNIRELRRLQEMYNRLPDDKKRSMRSHMQARINELNAAIAGGGAVRGGGDGAKAAISLIQTLLLIVLVCLVALGAGFFGVSYLLHN